MAKEPGGRAAGTRSGIGRLVDAEKAADEMIRQAKADAERILAQARKEAEEIRRASSTADDEAEVAKAAQEVERGKGILLQKAASKLEAMRSRVGEREGEVVQRLLGLLFRRS